MWQGFGTMGVMLEIRWNYDGDDCRVRIAPVIERFGVFFDFLGNPVADGTARRALTPQRRGSKLKNSVYLVNWHRNPNDSDCSVNALGGIVGKRLTYRSAR
jgi:hypothetical protein